MRIKNSMRNKLILAVFIGCLIPYFLGGIYLKSFIENWLYKSSIENTKQILCQVSELIDASLISDMKEEVSMIASLDCVENAEQGINNYIKYDKDSFVYQDYDNERLIEEYFQDLKESHKATNFIFLATESGGYIEYPRFSPDQSYDPRLRPWYQEAINQEDAYISEPYLTNITNEMVVSFTKQIKKGNDIIGVAGISVNLEDLSTSVSKIKTGDTGYLLVLSPEHKFIVSPIHSDWILKTPMECGLSSLSSLMESGTVSDLRAEIDGVECIINCVVSENGWHIISVMQKTEVLKGSYEIAGILVGIYIATFILILIILFPLTNRITKPILEITSVIKRIMDFDFKDNSNITLYTRRTDEIGTVASAFIEMQNKINLYFDRLTKSNTEISSKNELLTATEEELTAQLEEINHQNEYIDFLAYHDPLTDLPNRRKFIEYLTYKLNSRQKGAVILLDLDDFKGINDIHGHVFGDRVLQTIAKRFEGAANQHMFISRFGGDEFLLLIDYEYDKNEIDLNIKKINNLFREKMLIDGYDIEVQYSMGIALFPDDSVDVNQLVMEADLAMYSVKTSGKNNIKYFDDSMMQNQLKLTNIENVLKNAIKNDGFKMVYQPQVEIKTGKIVYYEALLRLKDGVMTPADFIDVAEKNGLIIPIGRIVTEKVIRQIDIWKKSGMEIKPVSINFSANQLHDGSYIEFLEGLLQEYDVDPRYIEIEITEYIFMENKQATLIFLKKMKELGLSIAIDDFGTGYSSLNYLTFLPVDVIKLDRSLNIKFLEIQNVKVMDSLILLVHSLGLTVVAEGIETLEHVKMLKKAECDIIQGYYFSKPLDADRIPEINSMIFDNY